MNYDPKKFRSRRRHRRQVAKNIALMALAVILFIGLIVFLFSLKTKKDEREKAEAETSALAESRTAKETETISTETKKGFVTASVGNEELHRGNLILVRRGAPYVFPEKTKLVDLYSSRTKFDDGSRAYQVSGTDLMLDEKIAERLDALTSDFYRESGKNGLLVKSAYRTEEEQREIYDYRVERDGKEKADMYVALPGESEHHTGMAFDMSVYEDGANTYIQDEPDYLPIYENAHKYGFILRYPEEKADITGVSYESWHFRYVGVPHAYYMDSENLCLEEYIELLREEYNYNGTHLAFDCDDGKRYEIYYVPVSDGEKTDIIVPVGYDYSVSGDNIGGFVVTVTLG